MLLKMPWKPGSECLVHWAHVLLSCVRCFRVVESTLQGLAQGALVLQEAPKVLSFQLLLMLFKDATVKACKAQLSRPGAVKMSVPPNSLATAANTAIILLNKHHY
jgi:hypothetical protein